MLSQPSLFSNGRLSKETNIFQRHTHARTPGSALLRAGGFLFFLSDLWSMLCDPTPRETEPELEGDAPHQCASHTRRFHHLVTILSYHHLQRGSDLSNEPTLFFHLCASRFNAVARETRWKYAPFNDQVVSGDATTSLGSRFYEVVKIRQLPWKWHITTTLGHLRLAEAALVKKGHFSCEETKTR